MTMKLTTEYTEVAEKSFVMSYRLYSYVDPQSILESSRAHPPGSPITDQDDLLNWLKSAAAESNRDGSVTATYVVAADGELLLASRRSEHVACASQGKVLAAGEIVFSPEGNVVEVSNQSTGYCPEPESWPAVAEALEPLSVHRPTGFTLSVTFRLCPTCGERNTVKDSWYVCEMCGSELPRA